MKHPPGDQVWTVQQTLMRLSNSWLSLVGERLQPPGGEDLDYWRIERADSAIIVPIWQQQLVLAPAAYRPGIGTVTLDFPGGRIAAHQTPAAAARQILLRELDMDADAIQALSPLNPVGWPINSSLSNQRLFGFWAQLSDALDLSGRDDCLRFPLTRAGIDRLLALLPCLQCRAVLMTLTQQRAIDL